MQFSLDKNRRANEPHASGNVLFLILIAIGLFGALAATVMNSDGGGKSSKSESVDLYADDIILTASSVEQGVTRLLSRGISEADLCFDYDATTGGDTKYEGSSGCATAANKVFGLNGGGLSYFPPSERYLDSSFAASRFYGEYLITDKVALDYVPVNNNISDLMIMLPYVKKDICTAINNKVTKWAKNAAIPTDSGGTIQDADTTRYNGSFTYVNVIRNSTTFAGVQRGCLQVSGSFPANAYIAYFTLIPR